MMQIAVRVKSSFHEVEINTTSVAFRCRKFGTTFTRCVSMIFDPGSKLNSQTTYSPDSRRTRWLSARCDACRYAKDHACSKLKVQHRRS